MVQFLRQNSQGSLIPDLQGRHVWLSGFGCSAAPQARLDPPEQQNVVDNYTLSGERAQAAEKVLEKDDVNASRFTIVADGPNYPGRVRDIGPNGQLILSAAEQDREVIVQLPRCT